MDLQGQSRNFFLLRRKIDTTVQCVLVGKVRTNLLPDRSGPRPRTCKGPGKRQIPGDQSSNVSIFVGLTD
jgi:hypothetical protein